MQAGVQSWIHVACFIASSLKDHSRPDGISRAHMCIPCSVMPFWGVSCEQWVLSWCPPCLGDVWVHLRGILSHNLITWFWCSYQTSFWSELCPAYMTEWSGSCSSGSRALFHAWHLQSMQLCRGCCWGFWLLQVSRCPSGCIRHIQWHVFVTFSGMAARPTWPWHTTCRTQVWSLGLVECQWCGLGILYALSHQPSFWCASLIVILMEATLA